MPKPRFRAKVDNGKLVFHDNTAFLAHLWRFKSDDVLEVTVEKPKKQRSLEQQGYYWGCILPVMSHDTGHSTEELHEILKRMFLPRKIVNFKGKEYPLPGSTTQLTRLEFAEYLTRCIAEAGSMGITIPPADPFRE